MLICCLELGHTCCWIFFFFCFVGLFCWAETVQINYIFGLSTKEGDSKIYCLLQTCIGQKWIIDFSCKSLFYSDLWIQYDHHRKKWGRRESEVSSEQQGTEICELWRKMKKWKIMCISGEQQKGKYRQNRIKEALSGQRSSGRQWNVCEVQQSKMEH